MITVRAGSGAIAVCLLLLASGCSREQQDWRSAEAADTIEGYGQFIQRHPESELATQARTRVAQLGEDRDWQHAGSADTVAAYRDFIAQHPNGKWAQEAHIRLENFSLGEQTGTDAASRAGLGSGASPAAGRASGEASASAGSSGPARIAAAGDPSVASPSATASNATGPNSSTAGANAPSSGARSYGLASPGEAASPAGSAFPRGGAAATDGPGSNQTPVGRSPATAAQPGSGSPPAGIGTLAGPPSGTPAFSTASSRPGAPGPAKAGSAGFGIQLGAFSTEAGASNEWRLLASRFPRDLQGLHEHVVSADTASGRIYRLQAVVGDEGRARFICDSLRKRGQACVAVLPH